MNPWIYSATVIAILASVLGIAVSAMIIRRVFAGRAARPVISLLLVSMFGMALAQTVEQAYALVYRASYDGLLDQQVHRALHDDPWPTVTVKVLFSISFAVAVAVKLGLYCDRADQDIAKWAKRTALATIIAWAALSLILIRIL